MRVIRYKDTTPSQINDELERLELKGYEIIDVVYYPPKYNHYIDYWLIKIKETK